ncbi:M28 family peptidase [bacterium]|nr:M28 family peptidase [bacterium]
MMRGVPRFETDIDRIREHITELTRVPRPCHSVELEFCRQYVTRLLEESGWIVRRHQWSEVNDFGELNFGESLTGINLVATRPTTDEATGATMSLPRLCVGAHLDSRPDTPGADDNASAVAALLEIARLLGEDWPADAQLELELVAFDLEENGMLGGREHARLAREAGTDLRGMISLEMLGYCDHRPNSQQLPRSLAGLYPDTGDFIAIIGNQNSTELIEVARQGMSTIRQLPVETLQVPENGTLLQATRLSDHSPFWDAGFPALMITDTSFLRNPHYHQASDSLETLDFAFLHAVTEGSLNAVRHLLIAGLPEARPLEPTSD